MPKKKKKHAVSIGNGKWKTSRRELRKKNTDFQDDDETFILELEESKRTTSHRERSILLFLVGGVALVVAVLYQQYQKGSNKDSQIPTVLDRSNRKTTPLSELFAMACQTTRLIHCDLNVLEVHDESRSIRTRSLPGRQDVLLTQGHMLLEIPRTVQTTTIDALRDPQVTALLRKNPRHGSTKKPLHPKAYLALHMALELSRLRTTQSNNTSGDDDVRKLLSPKEQLQRVYLDYLPTHDDFLQFHPISRRILEYNKDDESVQRTTNLPPPMSLTDFLVQKYFLSFVSEYNAFCRVSSEFPNHVSLEEYITSRLLVNTRGFSSEPLTQDDISNEELESYRPFLYDMDVNSSPELFFDECRATTMRSCMVPLLDAFDHHVEPNVGWRSVTSASSVGKAGSFINYAREDVRSGSDLYHSYGSLPDQFIYAQYGFINPDGSGTRATLLAPYHRLVDEDFETQQSHSDIDLQKYLVFRDGYKTCHASNDEHQRKEFEELKFKALKAMSNIMNSWIAIVPPRESSDEVEIVKVLSICRMIATTHRDYSGRASEMLRTVASADHPDYYEFRTSSDGATSWGLEYRTWHVLERLVTEMRSKVVRSLMPFSPDASQPDFVEELIHTMEPTLEAEFHKSLKSLEMDRSTSEAATLLVLLEEFETLTILRKLAKQNKQDHFATSKWRRDEGYQVNDEDLIVRLEPCQ